MSRHISSILDIKPGFKKSWTALVQVVQDSGVQKSQKEFQYRRLILSDSDGTTLSAVIYEKSFRYFACSLVQYKRYYISNVAVSPIEPRYKISAYEYSWTLNNRTLVEQFEEQLPMTLPCQFEFTRFSDLPKHADLDDSINIRAIVLQCFPSRTGGSDSRNRRDIVIVNEEKKLLLLTLWNLFDTNEGKTLETLVESRPVIFGLRLKVTTFNSLSLTTRLSSALLINPPSVESSNMKEWYTANEQELHQLLEVKSYKNTDFLLPYPKEDEIVPISKAAASMDSLKTAWVKGKLVFPGQDRSCWYTACANCHKSLNMDLSWVFSCPSCNQQSKVEARCRLTVNIEDDIASICATICTPEVEKLIPFTALQLKEAEDNEVDLQREISNSIQEHVVVAFLRSYETTYLHEHQLNISIIKCYKFGELIPSSSIQTLTKPSESIQDDVPSAASVKEKEEVIGPCTPLKNIKRSLHVAAKVSPSVKSSSETSALADKSPNTFLAIKKEIGTPTTGSHESPTKKTKESSK